jgi:secondary thiamine-phosphate synthase enzyme
MVKELSYSTKEGKEVKDITGDIDQIVRKSKVKEGLCLVFIPHTTCSVMLGEFEPGLDEDFISMFEQLKPKGPFKHAHEPDHAPSHLFSSMVGEQVVVPIKDSQLVLGTWQRIMLVEFDGPRTRSLFVQTLQGG